ncbi:MAG: hypothetical protein GQ535_10900 [Rhodobacteraceae bacterium]|nr:hypothetical protein [Paracoccaceae bacterium]
MEKVKSDALEWALRALAQPFSVQIQLYPAGVMVADELAEDWGDAFEGVPNAATDIQQIEDMMMLKAGIIEFWTDDGLKRKPLWDEIRMMARTALLARDLSTDPPKMSSHTYIIQGHAVKLCD